MKKPRILISDVVSFLFFYIGYLLLYISIFITMLNSTGSIFDIMLMLFKIMTIILVGMVIFGTVAVVIHILKWITWLTITPNWEKKSNKK